MKKRNAYRKAYAGFDPAKVASFDKRRIHQLLQNTGIVRNHLKIESTVNNARAFLKIQKQFGSFDHYQWQFLGGRPRRNH